MRPVFPCSGCGLCCQRVDVAVQTRFLDRGDGVCRHYVAATGKCGIYEHRPDICRVDVQFRQYFAQRMSWNAFVEMNVQACALLQTFADGAASPATGPLTPSAN